MKQINFVPATVVVKATQQRLIGAVVTAVVLAIVAAGGIWFGVNSERSHLTDQIAAVQTGAIESTATAAPVYSDTVSRITQLNTLSGSDIKWDAGFTLISTLLPKEITLGSFAFTSTTSGVGLKMVGTAPSNVSFASFVESIKQNATLTATKVESYAYNPTTGVVTFTVSCLIPRNKLAYP